MNDGSSSKCIRIVARLLSWCSLMLLTPSFAERSRLPHQPGNFEPVSYKGHQVVRTTPIKDADARLALFDALNLWDESKHFSLWGKDSRGSLDIQVPPGSMGILEEALTSVNQSYSVMIPDIQRLIDQERNVSSSNRRNKRQMDEYYPEKERVEDIPADSEKWFDDYRTSTEIYGWLEEMEERYPHFIKIRDIGLTFEKRPIRIAIINPGRAQKKIWIDGGIHAREWLSVSTANYFIYALVKYYDVYKDVIDAFQWHVLPILNPDGYDYTFAHDRMWRKTRTHTDSVFGCKGADANRNWNFRWMLGAKKDPCSALYAGPEPESEPCVRAVSHYVKSMNHVGNAYGFFTLHSYGQLWMSPWGYSSAYPPTFDTLMRVANAGAEAAQKAHNTQFQVGTAAQISGPASGSSDDWAYAVAKIPFVYTLELRDTGEHGFLMPPAAVRPSGEEVFRGVMAAAAEMIQVVDVEILQGDGRARYREQHPVLKDEEEQRKEERKKARAKNKVKRPSRVKTPNQLLPGYAGVRRTIVPPTSEPKISSSLENDEIGSRQGEDADERAEYGRGTHQVSEASRTSPAIAPARDFNQRPAPAAHPPMPIREDDAYYGDRYDQDPVVHNYDWPQRDDGGLSPYSDDGHNPMRRDSPHITRTNKSDVGSHEPAPPRRQHPDSKEGANGDPSSRSLSPRSVEEGSCSKSDEDHAERSSHQLHELHPRLRNNGGSSSRID